MDCEKFLELLSARLDGELTEEETRKLEDHLAVCPDCRAAGARLSALRAAFADLEDVPAPEGFARGVMERVRAEESGKKIVPLFKRPQFRALAGLAACLVVVVGLYGMSQWKNQEKTMLMTRSFHQDVLWEETVDGAGDVSACESLSGDKDNLGVDAALADPEPADAPRIAAYAAPTPEDGGTTEGVEKAAPNPAADGIDGDWAYAEITLTLDRMPEGGWELIPPDTFVSPVGLTVSVELLEQLEQLAQEQGIGACRVSGPEINDHCLVIILDEEG